MNGIEAAYQIRQIAPSAKILFFTIYDLAQFQAATPMLSDGFVSKFAAGTELIPAVKRPKIAIDVQAYNLLSCDRRALLWYGCRLRKPIIMIFSSRVWPAECQLRPFVPG